MAEIVVLNGVNYTIPDPGDQPNWGTGLTPYLVAVGATIASAPAFMQPVSVSSTPTTTTSGKTYLVTTSSIAITLNLPTPASNMWLMVKDATGTAATHNITLHRPGSQTIDGTAADKVLSRNFGTWIICSDGANYFVLNEFPDTGLVAADYAAGSIVNVAISASAAIAFSKMAALSNNLLARTNGSGVVVSDVVTSDGSGNLGAVTSLASATLNRAAAGIIRLANTDTINWRNNANSADKALSVDATDRLLYAGAVIANAAGAVNLANVTGTLAIANGGTNSVATLSNGRVLVSVTGAIVENPNGQLTNGRILIADASGNPVSTGNGVLNGTLAFAATSTQGIVGTTTNDNATAGQVGEVISASVVRSAAVSLTSSTPKTICSVNLTAGDWDVWTGGAIRAGAGATTVSTFVTSLSLTTNTLPSSDTTMAQNSSGEIQCSQQFGGTNLSPGASNDYGIPQLYSRVSVGSTTTYFCVLDAIFAVSTLTAYGSIYARRRR